MSDAPLRRCLHPGCRRRVPSGRCPEHDRRTDQWRGSARARGYTARWDRYRKRYLRDHPLCVRCLAEQRTTAAMVVDHITPHRGDQVLFWDPVNHQALCSTCHNQKTAREDLGFGHLVKDA